jgi:hypothetical protein
MEFGPNSGTEEAQNGGVGYKWCRSCSSWCTREYEGEKWRVHVSECIGDGQRTTPSGSASDETIWSRDRFLFSEESWLVEDFG